MPTLPSEPHPDNPHDDNDLDLCAEHADRILWGQCDPLFTRPYRDEDNPGEPQLTGPTPADTAWAAQFNEEGCGPTDLSPEDQWIELCETAEDRDHRYTAEAGWDDEWDDPEGRYEYDR